MRLKTIKGWVGAGLADAAGRLVLLSLATAYLARVLEPGEFGETAIVLSIVTISGVFVAGPYEEALAQRKVVRRADLEAVLGVSLAAAGLLTVLGFPIGAVLDPAYGLSDLELLLPAASSLLFFQAPLVIATAVARRRKAFYAIHASSLAAHLAGVLTAVALGRAGAGIWALIALRLVTVAVNFLVLAWLLRLWLRPAWCWDRVRSLNTFAGFILLTRLVENGMYLIFNAMVGSLFGLAVLGQANLAMRLIEPLRGAVVAITHNLCFSLFVGSGSGTPRLGETVHRISAESSALIAPAFMGICAISPVLVPWIAGPGWGTAIPIAAAFAIGGMLALPTQVVQSALSAVGKPEHILSANLIGLVAMVATLLGCAGLDPVVVGVARLVGDLAQTVATLVLGGVLLGLPVRRLLPQLAGPWLAACLMAAAVAWLATLLPTASPALVLAGAVASGVVIYGLALFALARRSFLALIRMIASGVAPRRFSEGTP